MPAVDTYHDTTLAELFALATVTADVSNAPVFELTEALGHLILIHVHEATTVDANNHVEFQLWEGTGAVDPTTLENPQRVTGDDLLGTEPLVDDAAKEGPHRLGYVGDKRFLQLRAVATGTTSVDASAAYVGNNLLDYPNY